MNRKRYTGDPRYSAVLDNMDLLGITDVSTKRQEKNGTIQWRLPLKNVWPGNRKNATYIEVASFKAGYVRRQNGCYTPYQLNKRPTTERYYKDYRYTERGTQEWTGKYNKYISKTTKLIPIEIDRLEYLISYCLKNYYIKHANFVANGEYVPKWTHEWELEKANETYSENTGAMARIGDLEENLENMTKSKDYYQNHYLKIKEFDDETKKKYLKIKDLEDKLEKLDKFNESLIDFNKSIVTNEVSVTVNGQKYKVI
jgi:hypothetical protein